MSNNTSPSSPALAVDELDFDPRTCLNADSGASPLLLLGIDGTHGARRKQLLEAASAVLEDRMKDATLETAVLETMDELRACLAAGPVGKLAPQALAAFGWDTAPGASNLSFDATSERLVVFVRPRPDTRASAEWAANPQLCARQLLQTIAKRAFSELTPRLRRWFQNTPFADDDSEGVAMFAWTWPEDRFVTTVRKKARGVRGGRGKKRKRDSSPDSDLRFVVENSRTAPAPGPAPAPAVSPPVPLQLRAPKRPRLDHVLVLDDLRVPQLTLSAALDDPGVERVVRRMLQTLRADQSLPRFCLRVLDQTQPSTPQLQEYLGRSDRGSAADSPSAAASLLGTARSAAESRATSKRMFRPQMDAKQTS